MRSSLTPLAWLLVMPALAVSLGTTSPSTSGFPQYPSLSPNGEITVFSLGGDLWAVATGGGHAERLTAHEATELRSAFSPDGRLLAFESNRNGVTSIFLMPVEQREQRLVATGPIDRLVVSDRSQSLSGFTPEGDAVLFWSNRDPSLFRESGMYAAPLDHGPIEAITPAKGERPRIAGETLWFSRGGAPFERPGYRGSSNHDLWSMNMTDGSFRRITSNRANDTEAFPTPSGDVILVSSRDGQNNIWRLPAGGDESELVQLTRLAPAEGESTIGHGVRDMAVSSDGSTAVFAAWDQLNRLDLRDPEAGPTVINLRVGPDQATSPRRRQRLNSAVTEVARHPDGKAIAVSARGELLVRSTEDDHPTHRITEDHARDQSIAWSPDGHRLYFTSDRSGTEGIWAATVTLAREDLEEDPEPESDPEDEPEDEPEVDDKTADETATENPAPKGDGEKPVVVEQANDNASTPKHLPGAKKKPEDEDKKPTPKNESGTRWANALRFELEPVVVNDTPNHHPMPSPDGRKLLYMQERGDLYLRDLASGEDRLLLEAWWPPDVQWASDSRHIVYATLDLDFNSDVWLMDVESPESATNLTRHPDVDESPRLSADGKVLIFRSDRNQIGGDEAHDVYRVFLDESLDGMSNWERAEHFEEAEKAAGKIKMIDLVDLESEPEETDPLEFENLDSAWRRARQLTRFDGEEDDLLLSPGGNTVVFSANVDGTSGLYRVDAMGEERKRIVTGSVSDLRSSPSGTTLSYVGSGAARTVPIKGGAAKTYGVDAEAEIVIAQEQVQKFDETARLFGRWFYHPDLKGLDWDALSARYRELARSTRTPQEFNRVITLFFGEVEGSHTGISGGGGFSASSDPIGYLGISSRPAPGGYEVTEVLERSPAAHVDSRLNVGDVIIAVNDQPLAGTEDELPTVDLSAAMSGTRGKETLLEIRSVSDENDEPDTRLVIITPISWYAWSSLAYKDEIRRNQELVEDLSDGRLGYLHIRSMNMPSVHEFEHQLYAAAHGKEGLVIDVRNNGGGWTTDVLLTSLTAPVHASTIPRGVAWEDAPSDAYPQDRRLIYAWSRPIIVLANQHSFSNAEIFTHAIKNENRGRVVGEETFGGVISTGSFRLIDGSRVRRPFRGWRLPDGTDMEARGAVPDIRVERTPTDEAAGQDRQLEAAVEDLVGQLDASPGGEN